MSARLIPSARKNIETALEMIRKSQKPFILVGGGAILSGASEELKVLAHKIQAPVADSLMGKGAFDGTDELYTGMVGMHGTKTSNFGISECDLLIVAGARFSDRVTGNARPSSQRTRRSFRSMWIRQRSTKTSRPTQASSVT